MVYKVSLVDSRDALCDYRLDLTDNEIAVVLSGGQLSFLKKQLAAEREK